jgi:hypothetical protein
MHRFNLSEWAIKHRSLGLYQRSLIRTYVPRPGDRAT